MISRKRIFIHKVILLILIISSAFIFLRTEQLSRVVSIRVYPKSVINSNFYGFGAETLPWLWTRENMEAGVNEEDIKLNIERIKDMYLPITRIFVPWETWNPSLDYKTFTWENDKMTSLYKTLDLYQQTGTKVILVTVDWLKESPWKEMQASAQAVLGLLEHLVKDKGYSCIQFWTLTNEPELTYGWLKKLPFDNYIQIHRLVKEGLRERKIPIKIIGSDEVKSKDWFEKSVKSLYGVADIFSSHEYFLPQQVDSIPDYFRERINIIRRSSSANNKVPFFLSEFGFCGTDFGAYTNSFMQDYEYGLHVANLCVDALNSGVDSASLWCLHQIRLIDETNPEGDGMMRIGLWAYKDNGWRPFPVFYLYRLFTRYIKPESKVLKVSISPKNILKSSCVERQDRYSLFVINSTGKEQAFTVTGIAPGIHFSKYIYAQYQLSHADNKPDKIVNKITLGNILKDKIPAKSVVLYTSSAG